MGRMHDALKKAEAERARLRREQEGDQPKGDEKKAEATPTPKPQAPVSRVKQPAAKPKAKSKSKSKSESKPETGQMRRAVEKTETLRPVEVAATPEPSSSTKTPGVLGTLGKSTAVEFRRGHSGPGARLLAHHSPQDARVEQFRALKTNIHALDPEPRVIALTSTVDQEDSGVICANLACVFAEERHQDILVVEGNLRDATLHELLGTEAHSAGLSEVLDGQRAALDVVTETSIPHLYFVSAGRALDNPGGLLSSTRLAESLQAWREQYSRVFISTPAVLGVSDAAVIGHQADAMLFVLKLGSTPRDLADQAIAGLRGAGVPLAGCVLTNAMPAPSSHSS